MATWGGDSASQRKVLHPAFHLLTKTDTTIGGKFLAPFPIGCNILKVPKETSNDFVNSAWVITLVHKILNVTDGGKNFLL